MTRPGEQEAWVALYDVVYIRKGNVSNGINAVYPIIAAAVLRAAADSQEPWQWALAGQHVPIDLRLMADAYEKGSDG